jgi:type I restriction-modification system DNA methylase subunit
VYSSSLFEAAVETAQRIWQIEPVRGIRMPEPNVQQTVAIDVLWTDGGLRPRANNLAFLIQQVSNQEDLERWKQRLKAWTVRGGLLVLDDLYLVQPRSESSGELEQEELDLDSWYQTLVSPKPHLFTPKALANLRQGQLSLADLEEDVSERSFSFLDRQQKQISDAFQEGIDAALRRIDLANPNSSRTEIKGHVIRFSIAYLAARILQDKNFFGSNNIVQAEDPISLLDRMIEITNGFFRRARSSAEYVPEIVRQELAVYMDDRVSFVLTDHRDVGRLYEEAIKKLPGELGSNDWGDLNRHYTPVKLAERMLEALPLERIRPEERFIFDPAAGSGSLLLAATSRLAGMADIPTGDARKAYLRNHVAGNDLDRYADLIAQLRYFIASESLGSVSKKNEISEVLPFPAESNFTHENYEELSRENLPVKPKVIIANPPFAEEGKVQKAARFVGKAIEWLDDGSQFAFVLPQSFLTATTHGIADARELLSNNCQILEVWQYPEGVVGVNAQQAVCVVLGSVNKPASNISTVVRAVYTHTGVANVREKGFPGNSWITENLNSHDNWRFSTTYPVKLDIPVVPLGNIFYVFVGVQHNGKYKPLRECPLDNLCKRNWRLSWRDRKRLWIDPLRVREDERWIRYGKEFLDRPRLDDEIFFDMPKIIVGRKVNSASKEPLAAQLDTTGFCPDNDAFCILPVGEAGKHNDGYESLDVPYGWNELSYQNQRLWLLGILSSDIANQLSLIGRNVRGINKSDLCKLPLPKNIDHRIIETIQRIIEQDMNREEISANDPLRYQLNLLVEESYGSPSRLNIPRIGILPGLEDWEIEQKKKGLSVIGQVLHISQKRQVLLRLSGLLDEDEEAWLSLPAELPGWALDGTVFEAQLSEDIETFQELSQRPWALRKFRHTPYPYLTNDDLKAKLSRIVGLENR